MKSYISYQLSILLFHIKIDTEPPHQNLGVTTPATKYGTKSKNT